MTPGIAGASPQPVEWSTDSVQPAERFDYWRAVIGKALPSVAAEGPHEGFTGQLRLVEGRIGRAIRFHTMGAHSVMRRRRMLDAPPGWMISLQLRGRVDVRHGTGAAEQTFPLGPGDIGILGTHAEMDLHFGPDVERVVVTLPGDPVRALCPWASERVVKGCGAFRLSSSQAMSVALAGILETLSPRQSDPHAPCDAEIETLERALLICLGGARGDGAAHGAASVANRILRLVEDRLADPELAPETAARQLGISVRSLHAALAARGLTFQRHLILQRLSRAAQFLRDPAWRKASVSDIAWATGFADLSHFSRRFRERFGVSPGKWRSMR